MINLGPHIIESQAQDKLINLLLEKGKQVRSPKFDWSHKLAGKLKEQYTYEGDLEWFKLLFTIHLEEYINTLPNGKTNHILATTMNHTWDLTDLWINYQGPKEYNPPHNHAGDISFVIYPDIPKEIHDERSKINTEDPFKTNRTPPGNIVFEYGENIFSNFLSFCNTSYQLSPKTGTIVIFPSWLKHHVYAFESNVERISVSGNIKLNFENKERISL